MWAFLNLLLKPIKSIYCSSLISSNTKNYCNSEDSSTSQLNRHTSQPPSECVRVVVVICQQPRDPKPMGTGVCTRAGLGSRRLPSAAAPRTPTPLLPPPPLLGGQVFAAGPRSLRSLRGNGGASYEGHEHAGLCLQN